MSWWTRLLGHEAADRGSTARAIRFNTGDWRSVKARGDGLEWRYALGNRLRVEDPPAVVVVDFSTSVPADGELRLNVSVLEAPQVK